MICKKAVSKGWCKESRSVLALSLIQDQLSVTGKQLAQTPGKVGPRTKVSMIDLK